ncbi:MAG: DUF2071 domain-containing protein [Bacteroidota bacterium]|nr:DUF2071 domain-containing protein [Bacteroidota bacterium]
MESHFLNAAWNNLIIANYPVSPELLTPYVPDKTELDFFDGKTYVSLVGFMFLNTKMLGLSIPYHINFEEVNLRFYLKHNNKGNWMRGVAFIKEIVPKPAIAIIANNFYGEKYVSLKMKHHFRETVDSLQTGYEWQFKKKWNKISAVSKKTSSPMRIGSEEEFIAEHYWGYTKVTGDKTYAYEVKHPRWEIFHVTDHTIDCDFSNLYGKEFSFLKDRKPSSIFMAKGSEVKIYHKRTLQ